MKITARLPDRAKGDTIEERVLNTLLQYHPDPIPFNLLARHCAGYDLDPQQHLFTCERIIQMQSDGQVVIADFSPDQDDIYAPVSLTPAEFDRLTPTPPPPPPAP